MAKKSPQVDTEQGTVIWGANSLRSDGLARLLDDLVDLEATGLADDACAKVRTALEKLATAAAEIPDGTFWRGAIYTEIEEFSELYTKWNSHQGMDTTAIALRRSALKSLRASRHEIAKRMRANQFILQSELDLKLIEGMYASLRELSLSLPEIFKNLAKAVSRYDNRKNAN